MVRIRYPDSVKIQISGVKSVIPKSRIEIGRRSMTWLTFLNDICGVQLDPNTKYFICTSGFSPNHSTEGWTASLNDKIEQFVIRFTKKLSKYCVRLHRGLQPTQKNNRKPENYKVKPNPRIPSPLTITSPMALSPLAKPRKTVVARKFASIVPLKPRQLADLFTNNTETRPKTLKNQKRQKKIVKNTNKTKSKAKNDPIIISGEENFEHENSEIILTGNLAETNKPLQIDDDYKTENLVDKFENEIDKIDETMLEQICQEIQILRQSGMWERNLKRSPLACSLLWEICKH